MFTLHYLSFQHGRSIWTQKGISFESPAQELSVAGDKIFRILVWSEWKALQNTLKCQNQARFQIHHYCLAATLNCLSNDCFQKCQNPRKAHFREKLPKPICSQQLEKPLKCAALSRIHDMQPAGAGSTSAASKRSTLALEESELVGVTRPRETGAFSRMGQSDPRGWPHNPFQSSHKN